MLQRLLRQNMPGSVCPPTCSTPFPPHSAPNREVSNLGKLQHNLAAKGRSHCGTQPGVNFISCSIDRLSASSLTLQVHLAHCCQRNLLKQISYQSLPCLEHFSISLLPQDKIHISVLGVASSLACFSVCSFPVCLCFCFPVSFAWKLSFLRFARVFSVSVEVSWAHLL